jgi:hypothetical protein
MPDPLLRIDLWDTITDADRERIAHDVLSRVDLPFEFVGLMSQSLGSQHHVTARFKLNDECFRLLPGGSVVLGYDRERPYEPNAEGRLSWQGTQDECGLDLHKHLDAVTTPLRRVDVQPLLMAERTIDVSFRKYSDELTELPDFIRRAHPHLPEKVRGYQEIELTLDELAAKFDADGFRLPTSDEWEHACSAGSRTLFRWGSDCPMTCYPDETPSNWEERTAWLDRLEEVGSMDSESTEWLRAGTRVGEFDLHVRPNAFGLFIADNTRNWEVCAGGEVRGGDGACAACGGMGFLYGWFPLASAYREKHDRQTARFVRHTLTVPT